MSNNSFNDDYVFPTTAPGLRAIGVLESACGGGNFKDKTDVGGVLEDAVSTISRSQARAEAMSSVLDWASGGEFTYDALDEILVVVADIDGDYELSEADEDRYNEIWGEVPDALLTLGCSEADVKALVDGPGKEADDAAARIGAFLSTELDSIEADDDDLIAGFAAGEDAVLESAAGDEAHIGVLEATYKRRKVVRDGKVQIVRKRVSGKVRLSAAQKAGLRKARRKAHTAAANLARKKAGWMRRRRGL